MSEQGNERMKERDKERKEGGREKEKKKKKTFNISDKPSYFSP